MLRDPFGAGRDASGSGRTLASGWWRLSRWLRGNAEILAPDDQQQRLGTDQAEPLEAIQTLTAEVQCAANGVHERVTRSFDSTPMINPKRLMDEFDSRPFGLHMSVAAPRRRLGA